ncbi:MAG: hypothetical protein Q4E02_00995 [Lagierella massiliensis]|nr:hypothetical protein [Lagierella massiliensis]
MSTKLSKNIYILFFIVTQLIILGLNFIAGAYPDESKYSIGKEYKILIKDDNVKKEFDLEILKQYDYISVVGETKTPEIIGLYDPTMHYYNLATIITSPDVFRYFSKDDYKNNTNVGILKKPIEPIVNRGISSKTLDNLEQKFNSEIINIFDPSSYIFDKSDAEFVKNLFSIKSENISRLYIEKIEDGDFDFVINNLLNSGWKIEEMPPGELTLKDLILSYRDLGKNGRFIYQLQVVLIILFLYLVFIDFSKNKNFILLSVTFGGRLKSILYEVLPKIFLSLLLVSFLSTAIITLYLNYIKMNLLNLDLIIKSSCFLIFAVLIVVTSMVVSMYYKSYRGRK